MTTFQLYQYQGLQYVLFFIDALVSLLNSYFILKGFSLFGPNDLIPGG